MAVSEIQTSFNAGELSPSLYSRVDLAKFESGAALIRNWIVNYQGGVQFRPGFQFTVAAKAVDDPAGPAPRVVAFIVGTDSAYVLEFGDAYIRYIQDGVQLESSPGVAYETTTPYALADVADLKFTQSADVMTITHPDYPPANLSRLTASTFAYAAISVGPELQPPTLTDCTATNGGNYFYGYVVTAVSLDGKEESLASNIGVDTSEIQDETDNKIVRLHWTAPSQATINYNIYKWGPIEKSTDPASAWGLIGTARTTSFVDNNIAPDFSKPPPLWGDPFSGGQFESITVAGGGTGYVQGDDGWSHIPYVPLAIMGDGTGAAGYAAIQAASGTVTGVWLTNTGKNYTTATIAANGEGGTGATFAATFSSPTPLNPRCAAYFQQRQVFAGSDLKPETLVFSQTGKYTNFNTTPISLDTDAIVVSIASQEVNTVLSMVPGSAGLLVFTTGGTFLVNGGGPGDPLTPASVSSTSQSFVGATSLQPLRINYDVLYTERGNHVRDIAFNWQRQAYIGADISALAAHLFDGYTITDWAYAEQPFKVVWAVRDDGRLLSCTYVPDQEVFAWARHDTQGVVKSVCVVPDGDVSRLYAVIQRYIEPDPSDPCSGWVNYIERLADKADCCVYDAFHLDSALALPITAPNVDAHLSAATGEAVFSTCGAVCRAAVHFDGDTILLNASLTATDNAVACYSYWTRYDEAPSTNIYEMWISNHEGDSFDNKSEVRGNSIVWMDFLSGDDSTYVHATSDFGTWTEAWHHVFVAGALDGSGAIKVYVDKIDVTDNVGFGGAGGDFTWNGNSFRLGGISTHNPNNSFTGDLAEFWFGAGQDVMVDGAVPLSVLDAFNANGCPADLGEDGASPTGMAPAIYLSRRPDESPAEFLTNRGTGGDFTEETGELSIADGPCSCEDSPELEDGDVIHLACAQLTVLSAGEDPHSWNVRIVGDLSGFLLPNDPHGVVRPILAGEWTYNTPISIITGLEHLEGKTVWATADGRVEGPFTVVDGEVELSFAASSVVVGLAYVGQIKTLYLTAEGISAGTIQGKRKFAPAVTLRLDCTRGLYAGHTFDSLTPVQNTIPRGGSVALFSGDARHLMGGTWDKKGEVCIEQRSPLPANITGVILEVVPGDTGR